MAPGVDCILEIHSKQDRILEYGENRQFVVDGEALSFESDPFHESTVSYDHTRRDCTPAPQFTHQGLLRIAMSPKPKDAHLGWVFGSHRIVCDVLLDENSRRGISAKQLAVRMQKEPGVFLIVNLSRHGTLMRSLDPALTLIKSQRAFGTSIGIKEMTIHVGDLAMELSCPDHSTHLEEFEAHWSRLYAELSHQVPPLSSLAVSAGPSTTHASIEYHFNGELGRGHGGQVYRAVNRVTGEVYAVKKYWGSKDVRKEAALLSVIHHNHIVRFHSFNEAANELVLEYIRGPTLRDEQATLRFTMLELKVFSKQSLDALSYLHTKGITHRDLKLDNVVVQSRSPLHIKFVDFNVSSDLALMKTYVGTQRYMAPEIAESPGGYDCKADVWSLGIMVMELFCGLPPPESLVELCLHLHLKGKQHGRAVSFIGHLLCKNPGYRPTAQQALRLEFLEIQESDAATALPSLDSIDETSFEDTIQTASPLSNDLPDTWPWGTPHPSPNPQDHSALRGPRDGGAPRRRSKRTRESTSTCATENGRAPGRRSSAAAPSSMTISDVLSSELWAVGAPNEQSTAEGQQSAVDQEKCRKHVDEKQPCPSTAACVCGFASSSAS